MDLSSEARLCLKRFMRDTGAHIGTSTTENFFYIQALTYQSVHANIGLIEAEARKAFDLNTGRKQKTVPRSTTRRLFRPGVKYCRTSLIGRGATCRELSRNSVSLDCVSTQWMEPTPASLATTSSTARYIIAQAPRTSPVFFTAPLARKVAPRSSPPARPPPLNFNVGGAVAPGSTSSPIDGYLPRSPDGPPPALLMDHS